MNTDTGIVCCCIANAMLFGETINLLPLSLLNYYLRMPQGFIRSYRSLTSSNTFEVICTDSVSSFFPTKLITLFIEGTSRTLNLR